MDSLLLATSPEKLKSVVLQAMSAGRDGDLLEGVAGLPNLVEELRQSAEERGDARLAMRNAGAVAAIAARQSRPGLFEATLDALLATHRLGDVKSDGPSEIDVQLFEGVVETLWSLGASLCAEGHYTEIGQLVRREPVADGFYDTWLRHGQVMTARGVIDPTDENILEVPKQILEKHIGYGLTEDHEVRDSALFGFDLLAMLVVASSLDLKKERLNFYPSFAMGEAAQAEWVLADLRRSGPLRDAIFPGSDEDFREVLREANELAASQAAFARGGKKDWAFRGFEDPRTWSFVREGNIWEEWNL